jgi:hypothetical protein
VRISAWDEDRKQDELLPHPRTDDAGRFEVEGVGAGLWHFEVQPRNPPEEGPARALAPIEALVRVPVDERDSQVVLVLDRGLYIEGRAIDEQGRSAREATVTATAPFGFPRMRVPPTWDAETFREQREEPELRWLEVREVFLPMEIDQVDAAGRFSIGPLPSGTYEVGVLQWLLNEGVAPVRANAGETDLELHLEKKTP